MTGGPFKSYRLRHDKKFMTRNELTMTMLNIALAGTEITVILLPGATHHLLPNLKFLETNKEVHRAFKSDEH